MCVGAYACMGVSRVSYRIVGWRGGGRTNGGCRISYRRDLCARSTCKIFKDTPTMSSTTPSFSAIGSMKHFVLVN